MDDVNILNAVQHIVDEILAIVNLEDEIIAELLLDDTDDSDDSANSSSDPDDDHQRVVNLVPVNRPDIEAVIIAAIEVIAQLEEEEELLLELL